MKNKNIDFAEVTDNIMTTIARDDELCREFGRSVGLTPKKFEFYLDNVVGKRKDEVKAEPKCSYCGSAMTDTKGNCGHCGL